MLGRRLLAFAALLLLAGAIAAALTPPNLKRDGRAGDTATVARPGGPAQARPGGGTPAPAAGAASGRSTSVTLRASVTEPQRVRARLGDLLELAVIVDNPTTVTIDGYGKNEAGDATSPARFEFIARLPGRFAIRTIDGRKVGELDVSPR